MGDCLSKREAEPSTFRRAARIEAAEAPPRFVLELCRNARTMVGDLNADLRAEALDRDSDVAALRSITHRIFNQIADRLRQELAMAEQRHSARRRIISDLGSGFVGERLVHFRELGGEFAKVEPGELIAPGLRLRAADLQHRGQDSN